MHAELACIETVKTGRPDSCCLGDRISIQPERLSAPAFHCVDPLVEIAHQHIFLSTDTMMTSVAHRGQVCQLARPSAVKPARRVVQVAAQQDSPLKRAARSGAATAAAVLLLASPAFAEQGFGNLKPEARDNTLGLPLSDSRLPPGSTVPGDEQKIREARKQKDEDAKADKAAGGGYTTTGTLLDPYGKEPSKLPSKSS